MSKNSKRYRDEHYRKQAIYVRAVEEAVNAVLPGLAHLSPPVTGFHLVSPFGPELDGHNVYYVVADNRAVRDAERNGLLPQLHRITAEELARRGYPESGIKTLEVKLVSQKDIDAAGGSFNYFR